MNNPEGPQEYELLLKQIPTERGERDHFLDVQLMKGIDLILEIRGLFEQVDIDPSPQMECQTLDQILGDEEESFLSYGFAGLSNARIQLLFRNLHLWQPLQNLVFVHGKGEFWNKVNVEAHPEIDDKLLARSRRRIMEKLGIDDKNNEEYGAA